MINSSINGNIFNGFAKKYPPDSLQQHAISTVYSCGKCSSTFKYENYLHEHLVTQHDCKQCSEKFCFAVALSQHQKSVHESNKSIYSYTEESKVIAAWRRLLLKAREYLRLNTITCEYKCKNCPKSYRTETQLLRHHNYHRWSTKDINCKHCSAKFINRKVLNKHKESCHQNNIFKCNICHTTADSYNRLALHVGQVHYNVFLVSHFGCYECDICGLKIKKTNLLQHMNIHLGKHKYLACQICEKVFRGRDYLSTHMHTHSSDVLECEKCGKRFKYLKSLQLHIKSKHDHLQYQCHLCSKLFTYESNLMRHIKLHAGRKFQCDICKRYFGQKSQIQTHMNTHYPKAYRSCSLCSIKCENNICLYHGKSNTSEINPCYICGEKCIGVTKLLEHVESKHKDNGRYKCNACNITFMKVGCFLKHYESSVHATGKCFICSKVVKNMELHMRIHTNTRPFKCTFCSKSFTQTSHLNAHAVTHSKQKPFQCDQCPKLYRYYSSMYEHKQLHHSDEITRKRAIDLRKLSVLKRKNKSVK